MLTISCLWHFCTQQCNVHHPFLLSAVIPRKDHTGEERLGPGDREEREGDKVREEREGDNVREDEWGVGDREERRIRDERR